MNYLEQQHFNAIQPILLKGLRFTQDAAKASEAITIEQMKGLAEWMSENEYYKDRKGVWCSPNAMLFDYDTTDELISAYLKTLS